MTKARYDELLGQLVDGVLSVADADELRRELERDPARLRDVRDHLMLSELLALEQAPHRTVDAFWHGVRARLGAEQDVAVATAASPPTPSVERPRWRKSRRLAAGIAAGILVAIGIATQWPKPNGNGSDDPTTRLGLSGSSSAGVKRVSLQGEVVCGHCILHQTETCHGAVRVREEGHVETIFLSDNAVYRDFYRKQGCGRTPLPVLAEGTVRTENGRTLLAVTRLEVQR